MNTNITRIGGVWMPAREHHMIGFLTDPKTTVDGFGTYQLHKIKRVIDEMQARIPRPFRRAIDVGAHVGTWTRFLSAVFSNVEAFEPHPVHRKCFVANCDQWSVTNATLHPFALGDEERVARLLSNPESSGDSWLTDGRSHQGYEVIEDVQVKTIDDFAFEGVDLIKLDCEGGELAALRGGLRTLVEQRPFICVEQKPGRAEKYGLGRTDACLFLDKLGAHRVAELSGDYLYAWD